MTGWQKPGHLPASPQTYHDNRREPLQSVSSLTSSRATECTNHLIMQMHTRAEIVCDIRPSQPSGCCRSRSLSHTRASGEPVVYFVLPAMSSTGIPKVNLPEADLRDRCSLIGRYVTWASRPNTITSVRDWKPPAISTKTTSEQRQAMQMRKPAMDDPVPKKRYLMIPVDPSRYQTHHQWKFVEKTAPRAPEPPFSGLEFPPRLKTRYCLAELMCAWFSEPRYILHIAE